MMKKNSGTFAFITAKIIDDRRIDAKALKVLAAISTYADRRHECWPSVVTLARRTGFSRGLIHARLKILIQARYLEKINRFRPDGGQSSNFYKLIFDDNNLPPEFDRNTPAPPLSGLGGQGVSDMAVPPLSGLDGHITKPLEQTHFKKKKYKKTKNAEIEVLPEFKEVIEYLNQKTGKKFNVKDSAEFLSGVFSDGYSVDDCKRVIDGKTSQWLSDQLMQKYIRPSTLFGKKFSEYMNEINLANDGENSNSYITASKSEKNECDILIKELEEYDEDDIASLFKKHPGIMKILKRYISLPFRQENERIKNTEPETYDKIMKILEVGGEKGIYIYKIQNLCQGG